ncbi:MAG: mechanosensitive ion channel protein MscS, partial [Pseudomonas sp.]
MSFFFAHLLSWSALLLVADAVLWHFTPFTHRAPRVGVRLALFLAFSALVINAGVS